jgi:predicted nucleic acid-binding protein
VHDLRPLIIYLDSNVFISACLNERSEFLKFWRLIAIEPVISRYAIDEISRNFKVPGHRSRFEKLLARTRIVSDADSRFIPAHIALVDKDRPILAAAITASVDYLITGDKNHFAHLYTVSGVRILNPADFLALHEDRLLP